MLVVKKKKKLQIIQPKMYIALLALKISLTRPSYRTVHHIFKSCPTAPFAPAIRCCGCVRRAARALPWRVGANHSLTAPQGDSWAEEAEEAEEAAATETPLAAANPPLRFHTGRCGSSSPPQRALPAGLTSKSKCKRLNRLV